MRSEIHSALCILRSAFEIGEGEGRRFGGTEGRGPSVLNFNRKSQIANSPHPPVPKSPPLPTSPSPSHARIGYTIKECRNKRFVGA
jgi:hypothetical protein